MFDKRSNIVDRSAGAHLAYSDGTGQGQALITHAGLAGGRRIALGTIDLLARGIDTGLIHTCFE
jgi:hypothetical protein